MHGDTDRAMTVLNKQSVILESVLQRAQQQRHRALIVLSGSREWCCRNANALLGDTVSGKTTHSVWIGQSEGTLTTLNSIPASRVRQLLGSECALAVFNAHDGLHPDALAAVAGTVIAGGALVLLTPPFNQWANTPDPDYERLASYPHASNALTQHFIRHVLASLTTFTRTVTRTADALLLQEAEHPGTLMAQSWPSVAAVLDDGEPSLEQQQCLQQLAQHAGVSVLLAGRGHGKSALLGFAARQWLAQGKRVLLVAPSRATAVSVFRHVGSRHTGGRHQNSELAFSAPDMLLQDESITADVLLIDEAAAIPLPMLLTLLQRFPRAVLATTTDGYEGTGQGFVLRFLRELDQQCPGWQKLALASPVRWAEHDPLEQWLYRVLLLDAQEPEISIACNLADAVFEKIGQDRLANNSVLLADVYGLLRSAHYRTTPDDLRFLLDAPALSLYRLAVDAQTIAVALVVEEGGMDDAMAVEIAAGRRRPRGHLLVQTLAVHEQQAQYLQQRVARVVRIAVHTQLQGRGFGSHLLQAIVADQQSRGVHAIGSSFSATAEVLAFWQRNGFALVRVGHKRQAASAAPSALVLRVF